MNRYPNELIALCNSNHKLRCIYYDMPDHRTDEARELHELIKSNHAMIKRMQDSYDLNQY